MDLNSFVRIVCVVFVMQIFSAAASAAEADQRQYQYPELLVAPSASQRLEMEAKEEVRRAWSMQFPIQASALATMSAGIFAINDSGRDGNQAEVRDAGYLATSVGASWLLVTAGLATFYKPYENGHKAVSAMPNGNAAERLVRERLAEEQLAAAASLGLKLEWLAVATNLIASFNVATNSEKSGAAQLTGAASVVLSAAPLLFSYHWRTVHRMHEDYKKRIYGPVVYGGMGYSESAETFGPTLNLSWAI